MMKPTKQGPCDGHICCIADGCECEPSLALVRLTAEQAERVTDGLPDISPAVVQVAAEGYVYVEIVNGTTNVLVYSNRRLDRGRKANLWIVDAAVQTNRTPVKQAADWSPAGKNCRINPSVKWMIRDLCADLTRNRCRTKRHESRRPCLGNEGDAHEAPGGPSVDQWSMQHDINAAVQTLTKDERWLFEMRRINGWSRPKIVELTGYSEKRLRNIERQMMDKLRKRLKAYAA